MIGYVLRATNRGGEILNNRNNGSINNTQNLKFKDELLAHSFNVFALSYGQEK
jgi:hypothetical protein